VLRRIFGPKKEKVTGGPINWHDEELHNLYTSPSIIRTIRSGGMGLSGHVAHVGKMETSYGISVGRRGENRSLGRPKRRWEDDIKIDIIEIK
jgi:hypothetical protein